jgi:diguanylate cyclase (GGDEF)-like protein/PAS domain S-box-containing protein
MEAVWSRERLADFVRGKLIYARSDQAETVAPPDWLLAISDGLGPNDDSTAALEHTHPEDRNLLIASFMEAAATPGAVTKARMRALDDDRWLTIDIEWLNQLDNPDLGCLICTLDEVAGQDVAAPDGTEEEGDHRTARWMVMELDGMGVIQSVRGKSVETLGYRASQLRGHSISNFLASESLADGYAHFQAVRAEPGATSTTRRRWIRRDGTEVWLEASFLNQGRDTILVVVWDITERRAQEQQLGELTRQFQMLADEVPAAVFRCDTAGNVQFHNARWTELVDGCAGTRLTDLVHPDDVPTLVANLATLAGGNEADRRTLDVRSHRGDAVWRVALRWSGDTTVMGSIEDVTATVRLHREVRHDALTGLLNRQGLAEELGRAIVDHRAGSLVVFLDLDGFKMVNDVHGHDAGDLVLVEIGRRLTAALRPGDSVGRYGGDELVVVCREVGDADDALLTARLEAALAGPVAFPGGSWEPAASVGAARPEPGDDLAAVLRRADLAMFAVKRRRKEARGLTTRR